MHIGKYRRMANSKTYLIKCRPFVLRFLVCPTLFSLNMSLSFLCDTILSWFLSKAYRWHLDRQICWQRPLEQIGGWVCEHLGGRHCLGGRGRGQCWTGVYIWEATAAAAAYYAPPTPPRPQLLQRRKQSPKQLASSDSSQAIWGKLRPAEDSWCHMTVQATRTQHCVAVP